MAITEGDCACKSVGRRSGLVASMGLAALFCGASPAWAQAYSAEICGPSPFRASTVTCTRASVVTGDVGVSPLSAVVGSPVPCTDAGTIHAADATAAAAQVDLTTAFNTLSAQPCGLDLTGTNSGGLTLTPGIYCFSSSAALTGTLTLNALGNPAAGGVGFPDRKHADNRRECDFHQRRESVLRRPVASGSSATVDRAARWREISWLRPASRS